MAPRTGKPKKTSSGKGSHRVRIRMYRHGLGDCFLLTFPKKNGADVHLMIDCGVVLGTAAPEGVMTMVAENIRKETGGTLDVLVITHEHWDHLSGFDPGQARPIFEKVKINSLWLGWTEEEGNVEAERLRKERELKKAAAKKAREALEKSKTPAAKNRAKRLSELLGFFGAAAAGEADAEEEGGGGTAGALNFLKGKCKPTILQTGSERSIPGVEGVRVYVMGPPIDGDAMKKTDPSKGEGYEFGGAPMGLAEAFLSSFDPEDERAQPFAADLRKSMDNLPTAQDSATAPLGVEGYRHADNAWRNIDADWLATGERLALQLDNATNNTSLVLAFEFADSNDVLLFVGDAQKGNWNSWELCSWQIKEKDGSVRRVSSADLLERAIFYKVGHHGSHNATMKGKGLELMKSDRLAAVIPVDTEVAHNVKGWKHMPLPAIRSRLEDKCAIVFQSDKPPLEKRKVAGTRWENSKETFEVLRKNKKTRKMETARTEFLYTDYFV